jgi:hypothetical protein
MTKKKITLNELKTLVKKIIKETDGYDNNNGDEDFEIGEDVMNKIFGIEKNIGTFKFKDALTAIIDYSRKADIGSERLANIVSSYLKNKSL